MTRTDYISCDIRRWSALFLSSHGTVVALSSTGLEKTTIPCQVCSSQVGEKDGPIPTLLLPRTSPARPGISSDKYRKQEAAKKNGSSRAQNTYREREQLPHCRHHKPGKNINQKENSSYSRVFSTSTQI